MNLAYKKYDLKLKRPFTISRCTRMVSPVMIVELESEGITGYGEAAPSARYAESVETVEEFLRGAEIKECATESELQEMMRELDGRSPGNNAAKAAIDIAMHDWIGKRNRTPLWKMWGLNGAKIPLSSFTIGIDSEEIIGQKILEADDFPVLKIKLGSEDDRRIIDKIRSVTDKPIRVDANEGWKTPEKALEEIKWLETKNVELVEQPLPASSLNEMRWLRERVNIPLVADESLSRHSDLRGIVGAFDGINIKLMKSAGLSEAKRMITSARAQGLKVMIGCMIESSVGISAASQLLPLADYADLDGNILISNDPFSGAKCVAGRISLSDKFGIGAEKRSDDDE